MYSFGDESGVKDESWVIGYWSKGCIMGIGS